MRNLKRTLRIIAVLLALALALNVPVISFAVEDDQVIIIPKTTDYSSASASYGGFTTSIKGLTGENFENVLRTFAVNIPEKLKDNSTFKLELETLTDAEKYTTEPPVTFEQGYDGLLCWASGAANILWTSGYAQEAVNPITAAAFKNEDEVFDYFRKCFADYSGEADGAAEYFMNGTYQYEGIRIVAQLRDDAPKGGLLKEKYEGAGFKVVKQEDVPDILSSLGDLKNVSCAAFVRYYSTKESDYDGGAHVLTLAGLTKDDTAADFTKKYKGIILADSDNDPVIKEGTSTDTPEEKARKAAAAPNSYTFYPLSWETIRGEGAWVINNYSEEDGYKTVLDHLFLIKDNSDEKEKAENKIIKVTPTSKTFKVRAVKKKAQTFQLKVTDKFKAKMTFRLDPKTSAKAKKYITVSKTGKVTLRKGCPKGTYKIKVAITAAKTQNYKKTTAKKTITIVIK